MVNAWNQCVWSLSQGAYRCQALLPGFRRTAANLELGDESLAFLKKHGFLRQQSDEIKERVLQRIAPSIKNVINEWNDEIIQDAQNGLENGYSALIEKFLDAETVENLLDIGEGLKENPYIQGYLGIRPKLVKASVFYSVYVDGRVDLGPTLWHRDSREATVKHLKVFVPLDQCKEDNGLFSVASKLVLGHWDTLKDLNPAPGSSKAQRCSDRSFNEYISDVAATKNMRREELIEHFIAEPGEFIIFDSLNCMHKGGLVETPGETRLMAQFTFGGALHSKFPGSPFESRFRNPVLDAIFNAAFLLSRSAVGLRGKLYRSRRIPIGNASKQTDVVAPT